MSSEENYMRAEDFDFQDILNSMSFIGRMFYECGWSKENTINFEACDLEGAGKIIGFLVSKAATWRSENYDGYVGELEREIESLRERLSAITEGEDLQD